MKKKRNGLVQVKTAVGTNLRKRENKWISKQVKTMVGTPPKERENEWISTGKNRERGGPT